MNRYQELIIESQIGIKVKELIAEVLECAEELGYECECDEPSLEDCLEFVELLHENREFKEDRDVLRFNSEKYPHLYNLVHGKQDYLKQLKGTAWDHKIGKEDRRVRKLFPGHGMEHDSKVLASAERLARAHANAKEQVFGQQSLPQKHAAARSARVAAFKKKALRGIRAKLMRSALQSMYPGVKGKATRKKLGLKLPYVSGKKIVGKDE